MGNQNLISALKRANQIPLDDKNVTFFDGRFKAEYIFQRHNFQMYKVRDTTIAETASNSQNMRTSSYYLRIINSLNDDDSIAIIEHMQQTLIHICHPSLVQYSAIAVEQEYPHIKFVILEEDLTDNSITLKSLLDTIKLPQNKLLALYFSEKQYIYEFILQALQALAYLNANGKTFGELHGDISPMSIVVKFTQNQHNCAFRVKILDYLKIRDLVEIAQQSQEAGNGTFPLTQTMLTGRSSSPRPVGAPIGATSSEKLTKVLPYDAPERQFVNQKDIGIQADVWSLGVVLFEFLVSLDGSRQAIESVSQLRLMSYQDRVRQVREFIRDVAMQELLTQMLRDHETRPTAEVLLGHQILTFFGYIIQQNISLDDSKTFLSPSSQDDPRQIIPAFLSALQLNDKNKAIVSFFSLMRLIQAYSDQDPNIHDYVFTYVMRQQAYIQMLELLVICMKEYSVSQSTYLAPQGRDSFTDLYMEAMRILIRALQSGQQHFEQSSIFDVTPTQMRKQFYLAGFLSLTMLLCEQVNRIAIKTSEPIQEADATYLELTLVLLSTFTEQASPTAIIAAEKAGLITNLLKLLKVQNTKEFIRTQTKKTILSFLATSACFMPVNVLKQIGSVTGVHHLDRLQYLCNPPIFQQAKLIYKRFVTEALAANLIKLPVHQGQQGSFEKAVTQLIFFCSIEKTLQMANAFQICTESLRLSQLLAAAQPSTAQARISKYDFGYICRTCTALLQGLTTYSGSRTLYVCYICAQMCHSKHAIEPVGFMTAENGWSNGCQCQLVQGFQVNVESKDGDEQANVNQRNEQSFHTCKARYETIEEGSARNEIEQTQIDLDHKFMYQEQQKLNVALGINQQGKVRKSNQITVLDTPKMQSEHWHSKSTVYTTESFDVVSICSCDPIASTSDSSFLLPPASQDQPLQLQSTTDQVPNQNQTTNNNCNSATQQTMMQQVTSPKYTEMSGNVLLSPSSSNLAPMVKNIMSRTMPTNYTPGVQSSPKYGRQQLTLQQQQATADQDQIFVDEGTSVNDFIVSNGGGPAALAPSNSPNKVLAYFEVKVMLGGFYDQVAIGLTNQEGFPEQDTFVGYVEGSIGFHADDGKCFINGDSFEYSSPYGSQSTVGCGYTQAGDIFFTRDGLQLPMIKSSAVWPDLDKGNVANLIYPVVSLRGKLTTVKVSFTLSDDFVFKTPQINAQFDHPATNIAMDKSLLKIIATELPKGHTQAILESLKNYVQRVQPPSSEVSLIEDFYHRLLALRQSTSHGQNSTKSNHGHSLKRHNMLQGSSSHSHLLHSKSTTGVKDVMNNHSMSNLRFTNHKSNNQLHASTSHQARSSTANNTASQYQKQLASRSINRTAVNEISTLTQSTTGQIAQNQSSQALGTGHQPANSKLKINYPGSNQQLQMKKSTVTRGSSNYLGPSSQVATSAKAVAKKSLSRTKRENQHQFSVVHNNSVGNCSNQQLSSKARLASSIEHSKDRGGNMKGSKSSTNLANHGLQQPFTSSVGKVLQASATTTTLMKKATAYTHNSIAMTRQQQQQQLETSEASTIARLQHSQSAKHTSLKSSQINRTTVTAIGGVGKNMTTRGGPGAGKETAAKHQQQLILVGSGQAKPIKQSVVAQQPPSGLSKQDSSESVEKQSNSMLDLKSNKTNYNSGNPSFFYGGGLANHGNVHHSQSVQNLKTFIGSDTSSLIHATGGGANPSLGANTTSKNGPKQSVKLSSKSTNKHDVPLAKNPKTQSLSNLLLNAADSAVQRGYYSHQSHLRNTASSPTSMYKHAETPQGAIVTTNTIPSCGKKQPQSALPKRVVSPNQTDDFIGCHPMTIPTTMAMHPTLNNGSCAKQPANDANLAAFLESNESSNRSKLQQFQHQNQHLIASVIGTKSSAAATSSNNAFYKAYTNSAQTMPKNGASGSTAGAAERPSNQAPSSSSYQYFMPSSANNRNSSSSQSRMQHNQVSKPMQNVSTSISIAAEQNNSVQVAAASTAVVPGQQSSNNSTKAHQLKTSYVKVPKPRLTSAMSLKQTGPAPSTSSTAPNHQLKSHQFANSASSAFVVNKFSAQNRPMEKKKPTLTNSVSHRVINSKPQQEDDLLQPKSLNNHVVFYPQLASNNDISVPGSERTEDQSVQGAQSNRRKEVTTPSNKQSIAENQQEEQKNCQIF